MKTQYFISRFKIYLVTLFLMFTVSLSAQQDGTYVKWNSAKNSDKMIGTAVVDGETVTVTVTITSTPGEGYSGYFGKKENNKIASSVKEVYKSGIVRGTGDIYYLSYIASGVTDLSHIFETDKIRDYLLGGYSSYQYPNILTFTFSKPVAITEFFVGDVDTRVRENTCGLMWEKYNSHHHDDSFTIEGADFEIVDKLKGFPQTATVNTSSVLYKNPDDIYSSEDGAFNVKFKESKGSLKSFVLKYRGSETKASCSTPSNIASSSSNATNFYTLKIRSACATKPPVIQSPQIICENGATISKLIEVVGIAGLRWYDVPTGGTVLPITTVLVSDKTYYASKFDGCESSKRTAVVVKVGDLPKPVIANHEQTFCSSESPTIADLKAEGLNVKWYDSETSLIDLPTDRALVHEKTYWAAQTNGNCISPERDKVKVYVTTPVSGTISGQAYLCIGSTVTLTTDGSPGGVWSSTNTAVATIDEATGAVTGVSKGSAKIYYSVGQGTCLAKSSFDVYPMERPAKPTFKILEKPSCKNPVGSIELTNKNADYSYEVAPADPSVLLEPYTGIAQGFRPGVDYVIYATVNGSDCKSEASEVIRFSADGLLDAPILKVVEEATCDNEFKKVKIENYNPTHTYVITPPSGVTRKSNIITFPASGRTYIVKATTADCSSGGTAMESPIVADAPEKPILGDVVKPTCAVNTGSFTIKNYTNTASVTFTLNDLTVGGSTVITPSADMVVSNLLPEHTYTVKVTKNGCSSVSDEIVIPKGTDVVGQPLLKDLVQPNCKDANAYITITNFESGANVLYEYRNLSQGMQERLSVDDKGVATIPATDNEADYVIKVFKNGCESPFSDQFTVNAKVAQPAVPTGSIVTPISCANPTAVITITPQQGVEYSIDNTSWKDDNVFSGLSAGEYTLYVRKKASPDCAAQSKDALIVKSVEGVPTKPVKESLVQPTCNKVTGTITIVPQANVEYSIDGTTWQTSNIFADVAQGEYSLYVRSTSDNTCIAVSDAPVKITAPEGVPTEPQVERVVQPDCSSADGGTIIIVAQTGVEYSLDGTTWQTSNTFTGLAPKVYSLYVRSLTDKDCKVQSTKSVEIKATGDAPPVPTLKGEPVQPSCTNPKGIITITPQADVEYSIDKNNWQKGNIFIGVSPGNYKLYVRNPQNPNCISESTSEVVIKQAGDAPAKPELEGQAIQPTCETPKGTIIIKSQTGVEYSIDGTTWQASNQFTSVASGTYFLYVRSLKDSSCMAISNDTVTINKLSGAAQKPQLKELPVQPDCNNDAGKIVIAEQTNVEYSLDGTTWQTGNSFSAIGAGTYYLYVRPLANKDCIAKSDEPVVIEEAPTIPKKPVAINIVQPTCENPYGTFDIENPQAGVEYSIDNKVWQTAAKFTNVPEGSYSLYARGLKGGCTATGDDKINIVAPASAPQKPTINVIAKDDKVNAAEKKAGIAISGVAGDGDVVVLNFGGSTRTITATGGVWSATYAANEFPADGKVTVIAKVTKTGCSNQDARVVEVDSVVPGDNNGDGEADDLGTPVVVITEDTDNDGYISAKELEGDIDYTITFPKESGYNIGDKLLVDIGQKFPLEIILTKDIIDNGYVSKIPYILVKDASVVTVKAKVVDNVGNSSKEGKDTGILNTKTPGDSDGDGNPDKDGSMVITITEDADNDGFIVPAELNGAIDYTITFPKNSGYEVGNTLNLSITTGADSNNVSVTLTADIIANGYNGSIANTFSKTTEIIVKGIVENEAGNKSLESQDKAVIRLGSPGDSDGDGKPDDAGKPIVVITEDEDNNGFITVSELKGDIDYTINFPKNSNYEAGQILVIVQSIGVPFEVTLTDEMLEKGYKGSIPAALVADKDEVKVSAIVKDKWNSSSLPGEDSAILKKTSEKKDAPSIQITEDADDDGHITATELQGDVDYTVTFSSTGTYKVGDKLVVTPNKGEQLIVELTADIIKNGYKGTLPSSLFKDGDILIIGAKITDSNGNESPISTDQADFATKVPGDSDGDGKPDEAGSPVVNITEDADDNGYINRKELQGDIDYIITLPKNSGYKVGDKIKISIDITKTNFKVKVTDEILANGYKGIVSSAFVKQGDTVKVAAQVVNATGDAESLEAVDIAILDKAVPGDSDKDGVPDKYGIPEVVITEDVDDDGYINPAETKGDIDYTITFPLDRDYTVGDTLIIAVKNREPIKVELTAEIIKDGYKGTLPIKEFKTGDEITIVAKVKDPAGNESLEGKDTAILNTSDSKAPLVRIEEDANNDGFINKEELQGDLDFRVLFPIKSNYKAGDKVSITSNLGTKEEITLTDEIIKQGYSGVIAKDKLPQSGEVIVKALLVGTKDEGKDSAIIKTTVPGDSDGDGAADPNGSPIVVITEDADNDTYIDKNELKDDIDYTVTFPQKSGYTVGDILFVTPNVGGIVEVAITQDILDKGYKGTLPAKLFKDGDEVIVKAKVEDNAHNASLEGVDKATLALVASPIPTVLKQQTNKVLPVIKGTAPSSSTIEITVNGVVYKEGDGNLVDNGNDTWELKIPAGNELKEGTYDVVAKATDPTGKVFNDKTTDELIIDFDADKDGIPDSVEIGSNPNKPIDTDGDGTPDYQDTDSDGDGIPDSVEAGKDPANPVDTDSDGIPDYRDTDSDGDGIPDSVEAGDDPTKPIDSDGNGVPDYQDTDSDSDRIPDSVEAGKDPANPVDTDGDGTPNYRDTDSDGDTIPDVVEVGNTPLNPIDTDGNGIPDYLDTDSDGDTIPDKIEVGKDSNNPVDTDGDGTPDFRDVDSDGDRIKDSIEVGRFPENPRDTDGNGVPDYRDLDSDGDGMSDTQECGSDFDHPADTDGDDIPNYRDFDSDNDGIADSFEFGKDPQNPLDSDNDGVPDYLDLDSDNDSVNDILEAGIPDTDGNGMVDDPKTIMKDNLPDGDTDGIPDYREIDSNNNGKFDIIENPNGDASLDLDKDGIIDDKTDTDGDGILDPADGKVNEFGDAPTTLPSLDAVDDESSVVHGEKMKPILILGNDTKDGEIIKSTDEVDVTIVKEDPHGALIVEFVDKQVIIKLNPTAIPKKYTLVYRIAQKLNPNNYDEAVVNVTVKNNELRAVDDDFSEEYIEQGKGNYNIGDVFANDLLGGEPVKREDMELTMGEITLNGKAVYQSKVIVNSMGIVSAASEAEAGVYLLKYRICEKLFPNNCSEAIVKVVINTDCKSLIENMKVPQRLTVNYDKINDTWELPELLIYHNDCEDKTVAGASNKIMIFNRWGMKVYEKENYMLDDERFEGFSISSLDFADYEDMPSGVYFYVIQIRGVHETTGYMYIITEKE